MKSEEFVTARLANHHSERVFPDPNAKVRKWQRPLAGYGGLIRRNLEIMRNFSHSEPFAFKERVHLEFTNKVAVERRTANDMLVLQVLWQVDTVVLTDILHSLRRQQTGMRTDTHRF